MTTLVTGGLGYIGSHIVRLLVESGVQVVIVDDYSTGCPDRVGGIPTVRLDLAQGRAVAELGKVIRQFKVTSIIHLAARKRVDESVVRPIWYYAQNVDSLRNVLTAMVESDVRELVFSSSAAVYGSPQSGLVRESAPLKPVNPYGSSKLAGELLLRAASRAYGLRTVSLRYFNVAGAGWPELADVAVLNLVPMVFERIESGARPLIFGDDYETPDGTCVRDFVHVLDLAQAHLTALRSIERSGAQHAAFNVGTGVGTSVRQVIDEIVAVSGVSVSSEIRPRRPGDPASVVAATDKIRDVLGWTARSGIHEIIASAWQARHR